MTRAPTVPGPIVIGMASGTIARLMSELSVDGRENFPWVSDTAERKSRAPAPIRKESTVIPKRSKIVSPKRKSRIEVRTIPTVTRPARARCIRVSTFSVSARKTARMKNGVSRKKNLI